MWNITFFFFKKEKHYLFRHVEAIVWVAKESALFKAGLMALGATQTRWWRGHKGYMPRLRKIYIKTVLKMPGLVFSFVLPRFLPDLMSISDSY